MGWLFRQALPLALLLGLLTSAVLAQRGSSRHANVEIQVRVSFENDRPAGALLHLDLLNDIGISIQQSFTDSEGRASFHVNGFGSYRVKASGVGIEDAFSDVVDIDQQNDSRIVFIHIKPKPGAIQSRADSADTPVTSAAQLRIPPEARKDFDKGVAAWQKKDYQKAAENFEKAIAVYPNYDTAYNNLGVMYAHLNEPEKAMAAFEHSVQLNDKNADADRNLARMLMRQKQFARAEDLLKKSMTVDPRNAGGLTMLSIAEIENGQVDAAVEDAHKVHEMPHEGYALSHFVAAQCWERKQDYKQAKAEYEMYLKESPNGPEAALVKSALQRLSASNAGPTSNAQ
jgi:tetratricopeptide (TPR) repeat protein